MKLSADELDRRILKVSVRHRHPPRLATIRSATTCLSASSATAPTSKDTPMTTQESEVDVLNELRKFERTYMVTGLQEEAAGMARIFAAVAEVFEACKERDEADGKYSAAERMYGEDSNEPEMREARGRIIRANKRYLTALRNAVVEL